MSLIYCHISAEGITVILLNIIGGLSSGCKIGVLFDYFRNGQIGGHCGISDVRIDLNSEVHVVKTHFTYVGIF